MTDDELAQLEADEKRLWQACKVAEVPYEAARDLWTTAHRKLEEARLEQRIEERIADRIEAERRRAAA